MHPLPRKKILIINLKLNIEERLRDCFRCLNLFSEYGRLSQRELLIGGIESYLLKCVEPVGGELLYIYIQISSVRQLARLTQPGIRISDDSELVDSLVIARNP